MRYYDVGVFIMFEEVQNYEVNVESHAYEDQGNHEDVMHEKHADC